MLIHTRAIWSALPMENLPYLTLVKISFVIVGSEILCICRLIFPHDQERHKCVFLIILGLLFSIRHYDIVPCIVVDSTKWKNTTVVPFTVLYLIVFVGKWSIIGKYDYFLHISIYNYEELFFIAPYIFMVFIIFPFLSSSRNYPVVSFYIF